MKKILFATNNPGKVAELKTAFSSLGYDLITNLDLVGAPVVNETGSTFLENAQLKAHTLANFSGLITIADDSGLLVDYLNGQPGVRSARYAGEAHNDARNNAKLLSELGGVPEDRRTAKFVTTIVASYPGKDDDLIVEGACDGQILTVPHGDDGFGYDPLFYVASKQKTFAQMTTAEKNEISHRGRAVKKLIEQLPNWLKDVDE